MQKKLPYSVRVGILRAESALAIEAIEHLRLADLTGTDAQVAWASGIRARFVVYLKATLSPAEFDEAVAFLRTITQARDYIDTRNTPFGSLLDELRKLKARRASEADSARLAAHPGAEWYLLTIAKSAIKTVTPSSLLIRMPATGELSGWLAWITKKAIHAETGDTLTFKFPSGRHFKLVKQKTLHWREHAERKVVRCDEFIKAWGGNFELLQ